MAYTAQYSGTDFGDILIDFLAIVVLVFQSNAVLLVTLAILGIIIFRGRQILDAIFNLVK